MVEPLIKRSQRKSLWDPDFDNPVHGESCFLPNEDKVRLMAHDEDRLRDDTEKLLGQALNALTCLINIKAKDWKRAEDQTVKENMELHQEVERLWAEVNCLGVALADKAQKGLVLAEEKRKISNEVEDLKNEMMRKEKDFSKATNSFQEDVTQSYPCWIWSCFGASGCCPPYCRLLKDRSGQDHGWWKASGGFLIQTFYGLYLLFNFNCWTYLTLKLLVDTYSTFWILRCSLFWNQKVLLIMHERMNKCFTNQADIYIWL